MKQAVHGFTEKLFTISRRVALVLVVVVALSALLITAAPPTAPAPSGSGGGNPAAPAPKVMGAGSYSEVYGWDVQAGGEHYGEEWSNYGHDFDQPKPAQTGDSQASDAVRRQEVGHP